MKLPLPLAIAAAAYVEKYGPDERYNYLRFLRAVPCPALVLVGEVEAATNMAFAGCPEEVTRLARACPRISLETIAGADHFYSGVREQAWQAIEHWLTTRQNPSRSPSEP